MASAKYVRPFPAQGPPSLDSELTSGTSSSVLPSLRNVELGCASGPNKTSLWVILFTGLHSSLT